MEKNGNDLSISDVSNIKNDNNDYNDDNECSFSILYSSEKPFLCKSCKKNTPIIGFKNNNLENIFYSCKCTYKSKYGIDSVIDSDLFFYDENKNDSFDKYMKCSKHNDNNNLNPYPKYIGYCNNHEQNFCKFCLNEHLGEDIIYFDNLRFEINENIKYLIKIYKLDENTDDIDILDFSFTEIKNIKNLLSMIINDYCKYPNYNLIKNIKSIFLISQHLIKTENNNLNELNTKKILNIKFMQELDELYNLDDNNLSLIDSISFKQINFDINILCKKNLLNLKELNLSENNIENIGSLVDANFIKLEKLDLSKNKINNDNIPYIKKFKFENLNYLNLYCNNFSDYEFFKAIEKFHHLKELSVGSNRFNIINFDIKNTKINLNSINKMHLINGVFSENTIKIITCFLLINLKEIFLDGNNLNSLDFIKEVDWPYLEKIYLNDNNISDIKFINKFKNLKVIEIRNNRIAYNQKFEEIINNMDQLDEINITGNIINNFNEK